MSIIAAQDLFEAHLAVTDLDRSVAFYHDVLGLQLAYETASRQAAFFWIGPAGVTRSSEVPTADLPPAPSAPRPRAR